MLLGIVMKEKLRIEYMLAKYRRAFANAKRLVANDDVYITCTLYSAGVLTKEQTFYALKIKYCTTSVYLPLIKP